MKKNLLALAAVLFCAIAATAQEARNQVYNISLGRVEYAHHNEKLSAGETVGKIVTGVLTGQTSVQATKYEADVKNAIVKGLSSANRFRFREGTPLDGTAEEGDIIANAVILNINASSSSRTWRDKDDKLHVYTWYQGNVEVMLTLKDAKTGQVIASPTLGGHGSGNADFSTSDKAIYDAIGRLAGRITSWLNKYRPVEASIIEGATTKKDKQKEVYIDLGSNEGAYPGMQMGVYTIRNVAGREARSEIGKLKIVAVEGEDISRCKVQKGGKEIKAAIEGGLLLRVVTLD